MQQQTNKAADGPDMGECATTIKSDAAATRPFTGAASKTDAGAGLFAKTRQAPKDPSSHAIEQMAQHIHHDEVARGGITQGVHLVYGCIRQQQSRNMLQTCTLVQRGY